MARKRLSSSPSRDAAYYFEDCSVDQAYPPVGGITVPGERRNSLPRRSFNEGWAPASSKQPIVYVPLH